MSSPSSPSSRALPVFFGTLAAFAGFAVIAALLQIVAGGKAADPLRAERLQKKEEVAKEQGALLEKYGLSDDAGAVFARVEAQIKGRKVAATTQVVPGSPTALKQAAAAPAPSAPAAGTAAPAPTAQPPAPAAPAAPAAATPAPAPAVQPAAPPAPAVPVTPAPNPK